MNKLLVLSIIITLFFGQSILTNLGWRIGQTDATTIQKIAPQFYLLLIIVFTQFKIKHLREREELRLIVLIGLLIVFKVITFNTGKLANIPNIYRCQFCCHYAY